MLSIPLQAIPSQLCKVILAGQNCQILIYQKDQGVFVDINSNDVEIVTGVIALDIVPLVCREYLGFSGNLMFNDNQGTSDPNYSGFGTRYSLIYLTAEEYALIQ